MQKVLGYVIEDSIVKEEEAKILTHINVAFGHLTMKGELVFDYHPFLKQMKQVREWNPDIKDRFIHCTGRARRLHCSERIGRASRPPDGSLPQTGGRERL